MRRRKGEPSEPLPATRSELRQWIHTRLGLAESQEKGLLDAIDAVFLQHERQWRQSKDEALHAVSQNLARQMGHLREELSAKDATVHTIARYFEDVVADLTDRIHRDAKTGLTTFPWFIERLEAFLRLEQQDGWCTVGLVDIRSFKTLNDTLGHPTGDLVIWRVAQLLREHVRSNDVIARQAPVARHAGELHARFGGDEFCFLITNLTDHADAGLIADRFRGAVASHDWAAEEPRLAQQTVMVDIGVVCLSLGSIAERRHAARQLAHDLVARADSLMYQAKAAGIGTINPPLFRVESGQLVEIERQKRAG